MTRSLSIRVPEHLAARIEKLAESEKRSINGQINMILERAVDSVSEAAIREGRSQIDLDALSDASTADRVMRLREEELV
jgi:hypothetical protein